MKSVLILLTAITLELVLISIQLSLLTSKL